MERRLYASEVTRRTAHSQPFVAHSSRHRSRKQAAARLEALPTAPAAPIFRRVPWLAVAITLIVLLTAAFAAQPIRDAVSLGPVTEAHFDLSAAYIAIAPISNILDTLTLLGARQHIAVLVSLAVLYAAFRAWWVRRPQPADSISEKGSAVVRETGYAALYLVAIVVVYAAAMVLPRPMASIAAEPSDVIIVVDFHAHTKYSHDGRPGWEPADVRSWHRAAGFDAVYISDHRTVQGAELGIADNPREAGQGEMVLQALEAGWRGEHVNLLGANRFYKGLTTADLRDVDEQSLALASLLPTREPLVIETLPGKLDKIVAARGPQTAGIRAIEVIDGSPRGLDQTRLMRSRIVHLADSLNIAMVSGSDNHGWGRAAPGWTLLVVPGWRGMGTDSLAFAIEQSLRSGHEATRVVERRIPGELDGANAFEVGLTLPIVAWGMFTTISVDERVMWIIWVWAIALGWRLTGNWRRRRRLRPVA
jgi:hypothetical protein